MSWQGVVRHHRNIDRMIQEEYAKKGSKRGEGVSFGANLMSILGKSAQSKIDEQEKVDKISAFASSYNEDGMELDFDQKSGVINITKDGKPFGTMNKSVFEASIPYLQSGTLNLNESSFINPIAEQVSENYSEESEGASNISDSKYVSLSSPKRRVFDYEAYHNAEANLFGERGMDMQYRETNNFPIEDAKNSGIHSSKPLKLATLFSKLNEGTITTDEKEYLRDIRDNKPWLLNDLNKTLKKSEDIPDTEERDIGGLHGVDVNIYEANLIDRGHEDVVMPFVKPDGEGGYSASTNAAGVVTQVGQAAGATNAAMIAAGGAGSAALGAVAAAAPWVGVGLMAYDWISGAADTAKQSREQITNLEKGIKNLETKQHEFTRDIATTSSTLSDTTQTAIQDANTALDQFTSNVGDTVDKTGAVIASTIKKGKGLTTGAEEVVETTLKKNINEKVDTVSDKVYGDLDKILLTSAKTTQNQIKGLTSTIEDIGFEIEGMEQNIDQLEESDQWYENLI